MPGPWPADVTSSTGTRARSSAAEVHELLDRLVAPGVGGAPAALRELPPDVLTGHRASLTLAEVASGSGVPIGIVAEVFATAGVPVGDPHELAFAPDDAGLLRVVALLQRSGMHADEIDDALRVIASSLARMADGMVGAWVQAMRAPSVAADASPSTYLRAAMSGREVMGETRAMLGSLLAHHVHSAVRRQRHAQRTTTSPHNFCQAVGFVDLVGFTSLSQRLDPVELNELVREFERSATKLAAAAGGRVMKHIGDEVMFTAPDVAVGCAVAAALVDGFADGRLRPRGGLTHGEMLSRGGDHYGTVVNLASRLAGAAAPSEVLVDRSIAEHDPAPATMPGGHRHLKGFDEPIPVWSLRR